VENRQYCVCENKQCDQRYNHWCYGSLCAEAIEIERQLEKDRMFEQETKLNRKVEMTTDEILVMVAKEKGCKKENITIV
jgi:hypothetical protein